MKTSKIIFISFFSIIGLFLLSLLIQVKPENQHNYTGKLDTKSVQLPSFSHLVITNGANFEIVGGFSDSLLITFPLGKEPEAPNYRLSGDTLIVDSIQGQSDIFMRLVTNGIKTIDQTNGRMIIQQFHASALSVTGSNCDISIYNQVNIDSLNLYLSSASSVDCQNPSKVNVVKAEFDNSNGSFYIDQIGQLEATISNFSELRSNKVLQSNVKTDETSRFYSY